MRAELGGLALRVAGALFIAAVAAAAVTHTMASAENAPKIAGKPPDVSAKPWSFGIEADTQWPGRDDGKNPNSVSVSIVRQLDRQFINKRVKFVVELGDLCDSGTVGGEDTRAVFAQQLYDARVGFYALVGNHDDGATDAREFKRLYPQTRTAMMNVTPASAFSTPNPDRVRQPFPARSGRPFRVGTICEDPAAPRGFTGLDYAFDYRNVRLVFLDQFASSASGGASA